MIRLALALLVILFSVVPGASQRLSSDMFAGMKARSIGPAAMSGRVAAIDVVESNTNIIYVGAATGGVWKSIDGGLRFEPIFDDQPVAAIGAIAVNQSAPDIVWVGTGEGNPRNSASVGNGMYKSIDGGRTWRHVGLDKSERIHRIVLHPKNADVAWAAVLGQAWGEGAERGVFKTEDGGKSWKKVLFVNERTGAADLLIDPSNPDKLFAAMWEYRRWPWLFNSGGPGSSLQVSHDGGMTWKRLTEEDGMPKGQLGRIGLDISRSNPQIVYALVEAEKSALLRSEDGGRKWSAVNTENDVAPRPFYFADIRVDPRDPNRIYNLWTLMSLSTDGGKNFKVLVPFEKVHPDYHALWINPSNSNHMLSGNDGGIAESRDKGKSWRFVASLPLAQFYHVNYDMEQPYNVYGGMQDNGSWKGPSSVRTSGGIRSHDWQEVGFGDGFATLPIPGDSTTGYAMSQEGFLMRWDMKTGERKQIRPAPPEGTELRFNWNAAIAIDPFNPDAVYYGSQFVHRSEDRGDRWKVISGDLTTNRKEWQKQSRSGGITPDVTGAENYTTLMTIAPSPVEKGVIWTGSDDGRIHLSRDGGSSWTSVEANVKGVPANSWIPEIHASRHAAGTAFVVFDDHRRSNWASYLYRTDDFGKSWRSITTPEVRGYAHAIEQDPIDPNLLFLGTEFGLFVTTSGGRNWFRWTAGLPTVAVTGIKVHPREHDLIVATHGRAAYVIDDIRPLRAMTAEVVGKPLHLFEVSEAQQFPVGQPAGARFIGDGDFVGDNRPYGSLLTWTMNLPGLPLPDDEKERDRKEKEREVARKPFIESTGIPQEMSDVPKEKTAAKPGDEKKEDEGEKAKGPRVTISVADVSGRVLRTFKAPARQGVNRASWDMTRDAWREPKRERLESDEPRSGIEVLPGVYTVTIAYKEHRASQNLRVMPYQKRTISEADRSQKWAALERHGKAQEMIADAVDRMQQARVDIDSISARLKAFAPKTGETTKDDPLVEMGTKLKEKLDKVERLFWVPPKTKGIVAETDAYGKLQYPGSALESTWDAPTETQMQYLANGENSLRAALVAFNELFASDVQQYRMEVRKRDISLVPEVKPLQLP